MGAVNRHNCPVCGYQLWFKPWVVDSAADEICPCCGIQFGYHDAAGGDTQGRSRLHLRWREEWIEAGMPWHGIGTAPPEDWDPEEQLRRVIGDGCNASADDPDKADLLLVERDRWVIGLRGGDVRRCSIDDAFWLLLVRDDTEITIMIAESFTVDSDNAVSEFYPGERPASALGPALSLLHKFVQSLMIQKNGSLRLEFTDLSRLSVVPNPDREAWELVGPDHLRMVCMPGGELALWT